MAMTDTTTTPASTRSPRPGAVASPRTAYDTFAVTTLTPHLGAEIIGVDLSVPLDPTTLADVEQALADWGVLVFRDQVIDREQHKAVGRHFGKLHVHPMNFARNQDPELLIVKTTADSPYTAGDGWHADVTCDANPPFVSALYITETPECGGGDTLYADMALAYELLSPTMRNFLEGLTAIHDGAIPYVGSYKSTPPEGGYPRNEHPVIARHPVTGQKLLYVNSAFTSHIVGMHRWESKALLESLYDFIATTPRLHARVEWRPNTLTLWDNRRTQHHAVWDYYPHSRYGERVSVLCDEPPTAAATNEGMTLDAR
ncbi:MAG: TauD/TfdA family dioxygenase [Acidimicrobiales bacterium]